MTEKELIKLEGTIRKKMEDIKNQRVSLKDSGIGGLLNTLKKVDEALYEKILPEYKKLVAEYNIFKWALKSLSYWTLVSMICETGHLLPRINWSG